MSEITKVREVIKRKLQEDLDWANAYWLDEVKEDFADIPGKNVDGIYLEELKEKVSLLPQKELASILSEQTSENSANQNFLLVHLLEEKIRSN